MYIICDMISMLGGLRAAVFILGKDTQEVRSVTLHEMICHRKSCRSFLGGRAVDAYILSKESHYER